MATSLPISNALAINTTGQKLPANSSDMPRIEKYAAIAAMKNDDNPTVYLNTYYLIRIIIFIQVIWLLRLN